LKSNRFCFIINSVGDINLQNKKRSKKFPKQSRETPMNQRTEDGGQKTEARLKFLIMNYKLKRGASAMTERKWTEAEIIAGYKEMAALNLELSADFEPLEEEAEELLLKNIEKEENPPAED
jgi:hypothetical protein